MVQSYLVRQSLIRVVGVVCFFCFFVLSKSDVCVCISVCGPDEMCFIWRRRTKKKARSCFALKTAENNNLNLTVLWVVRVCACVHGFELADEALRLSFLYIIFLFIYFFPSTLAKIFTFHLNTTWRRRQRSLISISL